MKRQVSSDSIDSLYRQAFETLSDSPAPNGWDTPSPAVWGRIQREVAGRILGRGIKTLLVTAGVGALVALGFYLHSISAPKAGIQKPLPAVPTPPVVHQSAGTSPVIEKSPAARQVVVAEEGTAVAKRGGRVGGAEPIVPFSAVAVPLPGSRKLSPNNTEANRQRIWETPLTPLPLPIKEVRAKPTRDRD
jgi:hypothetical protein